MRGKCIQIFKIKNKNLFLESEISLPEHCIELETFDSLLLATTSNFKRGPIERSYLYIINKNTQEIVSKTRTGGSWSKVAKKHPQKNLVFVSNWRSNNISIIDMENTKSPKIKQVIHCGNRPRGITFTPEGTVLVAGFYSRKLHFLKENRGKYQKSSKLVRFASKAYSGNMRDVLVTKNGKYAYVSNMGKNMVHKFDLEKKTFTKSTLVGKFPSSIRFLNNKENALLVSCRESNFIYFLDTKRMKIIGHSEKTSKKPTGLAPVPRGFLCTAFRSNTLEYHKISTNILV